MNDINTVTSKFIKDVQIFTNFLTDKVNDIESSSIQISKKNNQLVKDREILIEKQNTIYAQMKSMQTELNEAILNSKLSDKIKKECQEEIKALLIKNEGVKKKAEELEKKEEDIQSRGRQLDAKEKKLNDLDYLNGLKDSLDIKEQFIKKEQELLHEKQKALELKEEKIQEKEEKIKRLYSDI